MLSDILKKYKIILASQSPRRKYLLTELGLKFEVRPPEVIEESYPKYLANEAIALYLAELKAESFRNRIHPDEIIISADTIVVMNDKVYGKPANYEDSVNMLSELSGRMHHVYTGVCMYSSLKQHSFFDETKVFFRELTREEIDYYIATCHPFDKAGSYGAQDWIGYTGIVRIEGSYFNVMGLPVHKLYQELELFIRDFQ
jgi:septum formation protein